MAEVAGRDVIPMVCAVYPYGLHYLSLWFALPISMVCEVYLSGLCCLYVAYIVFKRVL